MAKKKSATLICRAGSVVYTGRMSDNKTNNNPMEQPIIEPPPKILHHSEFFFDNTLVAIQVENILFNVHKYQLAKSEVFSDMFTVPKPEGNGPAEGSSPEHPIVIQGVSASDFASLLRVLYASHFSSNQPAPEALLIVPAFRLANVFNFLELQAFLLPLAEENLNDVDKIVFAREFDIKEWVAPAHIRLCQRENPLNAEEARKLGVESVLILWRMREQYRSRASSSPFTANHNYCYACAGMTYTGGGYTCTGCSGSYGSANLRYNGPGRLAQGSTSAATNNNTAIEAGVKKWVEDGCTVKD